MQGTGDANLLRSLTEHVNGFVDIKEIVLILKMLISMLDWTLFSPVKSAADMQIFFTY